MKINIEVIASSHHMLTNADDIQGVKTLFFYVP